jgi:hypothetical protein
MSLVVHAFIQPVRVVTSIRKTFDSLLVTARLGNIVFSKLASTQVDGYVGLGPPPEASSALVESVELRTTRWWDYCGYHLLI